MSKKFGLDSGMYAQARREGLSFTNYLLSLAENPKGDGVGVKLADVYNPEIKTGSGKNLDIFEQLLMNFGIKVRGAQAATAEVFFANPSTDATILFPEFLVREFRWAESEQANEVRLEDLVATTTQIDGTTYTSEYMDEGQTTGYYEYEEYSEPPLLVIKRHDQNIRLKKYGAQLGMSYETLRRLRLPVLSTFIQKIALDVRRAKVLRALDVLVNGDGNSNAAPNVNRTTAAWSFDDFIDLTLDFEDSFQPSVFVGDKLTLIKSALKFDEVSGASATTQTSTYRDTNVWPQILGTNLKFVSQSGNLLASPSEKLLAVDSRFALEQVVEMGSELVESEKLISKQFERIVFSEYMGFAKLMVGAARTRTKSN